MSSTNGGPPTTTWYVRDASGNTMAVYTVTGTGVLTQSEQHLYGSSRLGIYNRSINADAAPPAGINANLIGSYVASAFARGNKKYELSNHLGNVLVTVSDKKIGMDTNNDGAIDYYTADVVSANDYYPFGSLMPGRTYSVANTNYRYGFNGKEKSDEIATDDYDFSSRILDTRLGGRWFSIDPQQRKYPNESNYIFTSDNPIIYADADGKDKIYTLTIIDRDGHKVTLRHTDESFGIYSVSKHAGIFNPNHYFESDLNVNITIDFRNKTTTYGQYESNFRQISAGDYKTHQLWEGIKSIRKSINNFFKPNDNERGSQAGGITFTSEFTTNGDGPKTDATMGSSGNVNVDGILAAIDAVNQTGEALKFNMDDLPDWTALVKSDADALKDLKENKEEGTDSKSGPQKTNNQINTKEEKPKRDSITLIRAGVKSPKTGHDTILITREPVDNPK